MEKSEITPNAVGVDARYIFVMLVFSVANSGGTEIALSLKRSEVVLIIRLPRASTAFKYGNETSYALSCILVCSSNKAVSTRNIKGGFELMKWFIVRFIIN